MISALIKSFACYPVGRYLCRCPSGVACSTVWRRQRTTKEAWVVDMVTKNRQREERKATTLPGTPHCTLRGVLATCFTYTPKCTANMSVCSLTARLFGRSMQSGSIMYRLGAFCRLYLSEYRQLVVAPDNLTFCRTCWMRHEATVLDVDVLSRKTFQLSLTYI